MQMISVYVWSSAVKHGVYHPISAAFYYARVTVQLCLSYSVTTPCRPWLRVDHAFSLLLFEGLLCEEDINECSSSPCLNGARCVDDKNGYHCTCAKGFTGTPFFVKARFHSFWPPEISSYPGQSISTLLLYVMYMVCWCGCISFSRSM